MSANPSGSHGQPGTNQYVERLSGRGFSELHLNFAGELIKTGQASVNAVAAIPSLHLGGTVLFVLFMWKRVNRWWRPLLAFYPVFMTFTLVYSAEHYVTDCLAGAAGAVIVHLSANAIEQIRRNRAAARVERAQKAESSERSEPTEPTEPPTRLEPDVSPSSAPAR